MATRNYTGHPSRPCKMTSAHRAPASRFPLIRMNTSMHDERAAPRDKSGAETYSSAMATAYRYMDWMLSPFRPYIRGDVVEIGIGHGSYYEALSPVCNYTGVDIDA